MPETSARLPALTNVDRPSPRPRTFSRIADAEGTGLAEEAGPPARRHHRRQRGVQRHLGGGVDHAEAVGADQPQAVGAGQADQLALPLAALLPGLGEAAGDHDQPVDALGRAVEDDVLDRVGRHRDDRHVDVAGDVAHRSGTPACPPPRRPPGSPRRPDRRSRRARGCAPAPSRSCRCAGRRRSRRRCARRGTRRSTPPRSGARAPRSRRSTCRSGRSRTRGASRPRPSRP